MYRKLFSILVLLAALFLSQSPLPARAAGTVSAIQVSNVVVDPSTTCDDGSGHTDLGFDFELTLVGSGDDASIVHDWEFSSGEQGTFGASIMPINTVRNVSVGFARPQTNLDVVITFYWEDDPSVSVTLSVSCGRKVAIPDAGTITQPQAFTDGRVNLDPGQHATVYCRDNGIDIWYGSGQNFFVSQEEIDAVPADVTENTLIASNGTVFLYRLAGGWLQMNLTQTPNPGQVYGVRWDTCPHSHWEAFEFDH